MLLIFATHKFFLYILHNERNKEHAKQLKNIVLYKYVWMCFICGLNNLSIYR